jgi:hypothetical protein
MRTGGRINRAIMYLRKIKNSLSDDQNNTYKQFLENLRTYREEQQNYQKDPIGYQQRERQAQRHEQNTNSMRWVVGIDNACFHDLVTDLDTNLSRSDDGGRDDINMYY